MALICMTEVGKSSLRLRLETIKQLYSGLPVYTVDWICGCTLPDLSRSKQSSSVSLAHVMVDDVRVVEGRRGKDCEGWKRYA